MVHVGAVDAPVTLADVKAIAAEVWRAVGKGRDAPRTAGVDVLGWEFAFELNELARQVAAEARVNVTFKKIPREVLEKRAVEQGFYVNGALKGASTTTLPTEAFSIYEIRVQNASAQMGPQGISVSFMRIGIPPP